MKLLLIDNYDSFTYNLVDDLRSFSDIQFEIVKHDDPAILEGKYDGIIISPGPGLPHEAGLLMEALIFYANQRTPILGVCLGLQAIALCFGGQLKQLDRVCHGYLSQIEINNRHPIFRDLTDKITVGRYHSWVADNEHLPDTLNVLGRDSKGSIMALAHQSLPIYGVQFHPESYMTPLGRVILSNFIDIIEDEKKQVIPSDYCITPI